MKSLVLLVGIVLMSFGALADISISELDDVYSLGDRLYIDLDGLRGAENGNLNINLVCENGSINLVRIPARAFPVDEDHSYFADVTLDYDGLEILDLKEIVGVCQIVVLLGGDSSSSKNFEVSDDVTVSVSLDKDSYDPGEKVSVSVEAVKPNGALLNGFIEGSNASSFNKVIEEGVVDEVFVVSDTAEAGIYHLNVRAYDVGNGGILNEGNAVVSYVVNQVASSLVLSLSDVSVIPGENFSIGVEVFDQSGVKVEGNVVVSIVSSDDVGSESVVQAGEFALVDFDDNSSVGSWKVVARFGDLVQKREFEMEALQKVEFDFEESVLVVRNAGNVLYNRTIDIEIGEVLGGHDSGEPEIMVLDLKIGVGEVRKFELKAPVGNYEVVVGDGDSKVSRQVLLTGNAISVSDFKSVGIFSDYSILWIFLIVVVGGIGGVLFVRYRKTRIVGERGSFVQRWLEKMKFGGPKSKVQSLKFGEIRKKVGEKVPAKIMSHMDDSLNFTKKSPAVQGLDSKNYSSKDKTMVDLTRRGVVSAESALVLKGEKHVSAVVALSVKNFEGLSDVARDGLREVVEGSRGKGLVDFRGDYIFVVFSPLVTRTYGNERLGVQCGMKILGELNSYNKKFRDKVEFGIGVHVGDLVVSKEGAKLKYTGIGNTISFAKRMSDTNSGKVVVSEEIRKKLLRELKVVKGKEIGEKMTYVVGEVRDRSGDQARLKELLARSG